MLKRNNNLDPMNKDDLLCKKYKNIARLFDWILSQYNVGFEELEKKERKAFESINTITSSAEFIKAVKSNNIEEAKKLLYFNVLFINFNFLGTSSEIYRQRRQIEISTTYSSRIIKYEHGNVTFGAEKY